MHGQKLQIDRRKFLQIGGAGIAGLTTARMSGKLPVDSSYSERSRPSQPVILESSKLELLLDRGDGVPFEYRLRSAKQVFRGEDSGQPIAATVCRLNDWYFSNVSVTAADVKTSENRADFRFEASLDQKLATTFVVRYALVDAAIYITLEDIRELPGFELIDVALPRLVTLREEDGETWLAHADDGGSLVWLRDAKPGILPPNTFWGNVLASLPVVMMGTDKVLCVQETTAYMDSTILAVEGDAGRHRAALGTVQNYRVNGSLCYDMNTGSGTARNCGTAKTPNLLIGQKSSCRLDFVVPSAGKSAVDWLDGARLVRSRMPDIPTHYYDGKFIYGIRCDEPKFDKPGATFEQCEQIVREIASLTDRSPQVAHLWGWQYRGKDTGYPAVAEVNPRIGGLDGLRKLLAEGPHHNCNITFSDNYDDAYRSSPAWDPAIIARRPDAELWRSRNWTGEDSFVIGLAKYMAGPGLERVRYTCQQYGLHETIHVDVLSYFTIRDDWDPERPASGIRNLFEGRYKVIDEFKRYGVDVSSEAMRYAAIGKISFFWHIASQKTCPFGGKPIPLQPMIYRKSAVWGEGGGRGTLIDRIMTTLFSNGCMHLILRNDTDWKDVADLYYLNLLPWSKIMNRNIESFEQQGDRTVIGLEGNSRIEQDWAAKTYSVSVNGVEIARDLATCCQLDPDRIAFYAQTGRELVAPMPKGWKKDQLAAILLSPTGAEAARLGFSDGLIRVHVPGRQPILVFRDGPAAKKRLIKDARARL
ncbi:MAG TPA: endo-alpha-N-acetylgalactosaminidase family protein [Candidatus Acidoferrum sp.]|nr:endo-alpha-N-acetylgalactosaminidase family protein [Candidatus Acidoferrum sp.]